MQLAYSFRPIDVLRIVKKGNYVKTLEETCIQYTQTQNMIINWMIAGSEFNNIFM
jgi:hypothetical protein